MLWISAVPFPRQPSFYLTLSFRCSFSRSSVDSRKLSTSVLTGDKLSVISNLTAYVENVSFPS